MQPFHFVVRFDLLPGKEEEFRTALLAVSSPTRNESGCLQMNVFESLDEPVHFVIHSLWVNEAAFNHHANQPHTVAFVETCGRLLSHPVQGSRLRAI